MKRLTFSNPFGFEKQNGLNIQPIFFKQFQPILTQQNCHERTLESVILHLQNLNIF